MTKKEFTSCDIAAVVIELRKTIPNSRVSNVYQLDGKTLLFKLRRTSEPVSWLILEAGGRLHITSYSVEKPKIPPSFCMALRKHLRNCWLTDVEQCGFERIVVFTFKTETGDMHLFLELFGDGNIILVDKDNKILHALSYKHMRDRNILQGEDFRFPPSGGRDPLKIRKEVFLKELHNSGDVEIVRSLARILRIGGLYAEEILLRAKIDKKKPSNIIDDDVAGDIFDELQSLLSRVTVGELEPNIVLDETGNFVDVVPVKLERYAEFRNQFYSSFNEASDQFYARTFAIRRALISTSKDIEELRQEAERLERMITSQKKTLIQAEAEATRNKQIGNVIYIHSSELQALMNRFLCGKKDGKSWRNIISKLVVEKEAGLSPSVFFKSLDPRGFMVDVCVDDLCFTMNLHKNLHANATRFYERSKRAKRRFKGAKTALDESQKKLQEIEIRMRETEASERAKPTEAVEELDKRKIKLKRWFEKFRWFISSDGFLVVAGKDAVSNEVLIKKHTEDEDVVFHADVFGAPFVVVKTEAKEPSQQCLQEASKFAAAFSRGWREGFASVDIYSVGPEQLSRRSNSGEYIPRGAFVVRGHRNWIRGVQLEIGVGAIVEEEKVRFVGGPVDAVKAHTQMYVVVIPGDSEGKKLFKDILKALAEKLPRELRNKVLKASIEQIREYIPYNKGRLAES